MIKRIISAAIGLALFITVLFVSDTFKYTFNAVVSILSVISVGEIFVATKYVENKPLLFSGLIFAAIVPFFRTPYFNMTSKAVCFIYIVILFCIMVKNKDKVRIEQIGLVYMMSTLLPFAFSCLVYLRDIGFNYQYGLAKRDGVFLLLISCAGAWLADTGAYFTGRFFGKHKLAPEISPNKTIEGFVGGVVTNIIGMAAIGILYEKNFSAGAKINIPLLMIMGFCLAFAGTLGDLSASFIKRCCNIKDFGNIMPGHGGVLDRFDSVMLVAPFTYMFIEVFQSGIWPLIIR